MKANKFVQYEKPQKIEDARAWKNYYTSDAPWKFHLSPAP